MENLRFIMGVEDSWSQVLNCEFFYWAKIGEITRYRIKLTNYHLLLNPCMREDDKEK
jgi:hypothetical protein